MAIGKNTILSAEEMNIIKTLARFKETPVYKKQLIVSYRFAGEELVAAAETLERSGLLEFKLESRQESIGFVKVAREKVKNLIAILPEAERKGLAA
jgi:hypothetical protein